MLARLFLLLILVPVVEIVLLAWIARATSVLFVLGLVIGTGIVGAWLARHQGLQTVRRISADVEAGRMPAESLVDGLLVLLAAVLLVVPGLLTDVAALVLLFPPSRRVAKALLRRRLQARVIAMHIQAFGSRAEHDEIIDVKVIENTPRPLP